jgi:hypothetical protein
MAVQNVDVVLVIDASASMKPCIDQLRCHLRELIKPMQGAVGQVRFGLVAVNALKTKDGTGIVYPISTLASNYAQSSQAIYRSGSNQDELLTDNPDRVIECLESIQLQGDENNLLALDMALDHPFGPVSTTKRVVALFSDEPLEAGIERLAPGKHIPALIEKIHQRRVKLFCALPLSDWASELSQASGSEIEAIDGGQGLASVNFRALLGQMGKSISVSSMQGGLEEKYQRALFGQDRWGVRDDIDPRSQDNR